MTPVDTEAVGPSSGASTHWPGPVTPTVHVQHEFWGREGGVFSLLHPNFDMDFNEDRLEFSDSLVWPSWWSRGSEPLGARKLYLKFFCPMDSAC